MTDNERKLAAHLMDLAGELLSRRICNDLDLAEFMPDVEERRAFVKAFNVFNRSPDEFDPESDCRRDLPDWAALAFLAHKLLKES